MLHQNVEQNVEQNVKPNVRQCSSKCETKCSNKCGTWPKFPKLFPPAPKKKERDGRTETGGRALRDGGGQGILKLNVQHLFKICLTFC